MALVKTTLKINTCKHGHVNPPRYKNGKCIPCHTSGGQRGVALPVPGADPIETERLRQEANRLIQEERAAIREVAGERGFRTFLGELIHSTAQRFDAPPKYVAPAKKTGTVEESMLQCLSDWHAYEIVSAERTRDHNEYNALIMGQRVKAVVQSHLHIKRMMEKGGGWRFEGLHLGLNGDFVSGTIHEVERHSDAKSIAHAVYGCGIVLAQAIRDLAAAYPVVDLYCSAGNHGRLPDARRMQQKDPTRSWDTMIYWYAKEHLRGLKNLRWHIPDSYSVAFDIEGYRFFQTHGHDVKSWNSIPHYGINRLVSNLNALEAARNRAINYFLFGHFHNTTSLEHAAGEWFINGSLIGGTEFGIAAMGKADKPRQWMLGVHQEHGVTHRWPLRGDQADVVGYETQPWEGE